MGFVLLVWVPVVLSSNYPPHASVSVTVPQNGSAVGADFDVTCDIAVHGDSQAFINAHRTSTVCLALSGVRMRCVDIFTARIRISLGALLLGGRLRHGTHVLEAWLEWGEGAEARGWGATGTAVPRSRAPRIAITVVREEKLQRLLHAQEARERAELSAAGGAAGGAGLSPGVPDDGDALLQWASWHRTRRQQQGGGSSDESGNSDDHRASPLQGPTSRALLVIGVKSAARHFVARQAQRETWLSLAAAGTGGQGGGARKSRGGLARAWPPSLPHTRYWFVVGSADDAAVRAALVEEQRAFGDLLLGPQLYGIQDSYYALPRKTLAFLAHAARHCHSKRRGGSSGSCFGFALMVDDDVFLRLDQLHRALSRAARAETERRKAEAGAGANIVTEAEWGIEPHGFYHGQVWATALGRPIRPHRDPDVRNYISEQDFPFDAFPPFATGPHYVLGWAGAADFLVSNRAALAAGAVGTLEDVSVAVWLRAVGVVPQHIPQWASARDEPCSESLVSFADLSPAGVRGLWEDLARAAAVARVEGRGGGYGVGVDHGFGTGVDGRAVGLCARFAARQTQWVKPHSLTKRSAAEYAEEKRALALELKTRRWQSRAGAGADAVANTVADAQSQQHGGAKGAQVSAVETPREALETLRVHGWRRAMDPSSGEYYFFNVNGTDVALGALELLAALGISSAGRDQGGKPGALSFGSSATGSVTGGAATGAAGLFDVLVASPIDGGCPQGWDARCRAAFAQLVRTHRRAGPNAANASVVVLWSGEAWALGDVAPADVLVDTKHPDAAAMDGDVGAAGMAGTAVVPAPPARWVQRGGTPALYMPVVSVSFGERAAHSPLDLLRRDRDPATVLSRKNRFVGYLYSRCDGVGRARREALFDALRERARAARMDSSPSGRVEALGACRGGQRARDESKLASRFGPRFHDDAVEKLRPYKFAIAFEHTSGARADGAAVGSSTPYRGYVTEKIVSAMLAGAIPVYDGAPEAARWFNPRAYIDCSCAVPDATAVSGCAEGETALVRRCADRVMAVQRNHTEYARMLAEPWLRDGSAALLHELVGWHPALANAEGRGGGRSGNVESTEEAVGGGAETGGERFDARAFSSRLGATIASVLRRRVNE
eukprot:g330.t1